MTIKFFVTGTDTGVGKTYTSVALLKKFNALGLSTLGVKPISSGSQRRNDKLYNEDAVALQQASSIKLSYEYINPFVFEQPIAPHLAAKMSKIPLNQKEVLEKINQTFSFYADVFVVEGAGGWLVPLNDRELMSDLVKALHIPVVVVVAIKLGCLNHALLTVRAIQAARIPLIGWVANSMDPTAEAVAENIQTLQHWISAPCLGIVPYNKAPENFITVEPIITYFNKVASPEENAR